MGAEFKEEKTKETEEISTLNKEKNRLLALRQRRSELLEKRKSANLDEELRKHGLTTAAGISVTETKDNSGQGQALQIGMLAQYAKLYIILLLSVILNMLFDR